MRRPSLLFLAQENVILGGQAVLEGVMMRSPKAFAVAVRRPDGEIAFMGDLAPSWTAKHKLLRTPGLRGVLTLFQTLALGMRALNFSSETAFPEEQRAPGRSDNRIAWELYLSLALALVLGVALFFLLPLGVTEGARRLFPGLGDGLVFNLLEGVIRGAVFFVYIASIRMAPDIKRLFRYHGAEHKVVHAFEARCGMDVQDVQRYSVLHPRCGTSFLLFVMVVSIVVFSFIPGTLPLWGKILFRLVLLPVVVGVSYELIRWSGRSQLRLAKALTVPGMMLQKLTTGEPDDDMVQVALAAFQRAAELEGGQEALVL